MVTYNGSLLSHNSPLNGFRLIVLPALEVVRLNSVVLGLLELPGGLFLPIVILPFDVRALEVPDVLAVPEKLRY